MAIPTATCSQYWSQIPRTYFTGDGARKDKDGYFWVMGRVDDVINVSGHRLSTMEVESALVAHEAVAEAAVVARPDDIKGQAISAFVTLEQGRKPTPELKDELRKWVAKEIGAMAKPDDIRFTDMLPKTRSGKIMRRLLRELASSGEVKGDTTTLEDFGSNRKAERKRRGLTRHEPVRVAPGILPAVLRASCPPAGGRHHDSRRDGGAAMITPPLPSSRLAS